MTLWEDHRDPTARLPMFLLQMFVVLVVTRFLGWAIKRLYQPKVIGEILAGIVLGPTVLSRIDGFKESVFPEASLPLFGVVANLGLILFMFFLGLELDFRVMRRQLHVAAPIAVAAIAFPFAVGAISSLWLYDVNDQDEAGRTAFVLFFGAAMSFTAFPVLASILQTARLLRDPLGVLAISCAAIDDITAWCVLAFASSFAMSNNPINGLYTTLIATLYVLCMLFLVRPALVFLNNSFIKSNAKRQAAKAELEAAMRGELPPVHHANDGVPVPGGMPAQGGRGRKGSDSSEFSEVDGPGAVAVKVAKAVQAHTVSTSGDDSVVPDSGATPALPTPQARSEGAVRRASRSGGARSAKAEQAAAVAAAAASESAHGKAAAHFSHTQVTIVFLMLLASSFVTESIGIHAFFGAFLAGVIVPKEGPFVPMLAERLEVVAGDFLLPLFFANAGLKLNINSLAAKDLGALVFVILMACIAKFVPSILVSKIVTRKSWGFCASLGILMNTRGLVELIVLNIGLDAKILSIKMYTMMVIMAVLTTGMTPPLLHLFYLRHRRGKASDAPKDDGTASIARGHSLHGTHTGGDGEVELEGEEGLGDDDLEGGVGIGMPRNESFVEHYHGALFMSQHPAQEPTYPRERRASSGAALGDHVGTAGEPQGVVV